jgi:hypothetical protein
MTTNTTSNAADYAATIADELGKWHAALTGDHHAMTEIVREIGFTPDSWMDYIETVALDIDYFHNHATGQTITEILRTTGGPGCRIIRDSRDDGRVSVSAYWWGDPVGTVDKYLPDLAEAIDAAAEADRDQFEAGR